MRCVIGIASSCLLALSIPSQKSLPSCQDPRDPLILS